jgi:uncharacterized protein (TIGR02268 family)
MPEVRVSPGVATVLLFDLPPVRVELAERSRFRAVGLDGSVVTLVPAESLHEVEQVRLTAHFADGAAPTSATFMLRAVPSALAERQVEVHRRPRTLESYQEELTQLRGELQQCGQEAERLRTAPAPVDGIIGLLMTGHMNAEGVAVRELLRELVGHPRNTLATKRALTYRAAKRVAVALELANPRAQPWQAESASLKDKAGSPLRMVRVWQRPTVVPGEPNRVVVEAEADPTEARGPFTLSLWEAGGKRAIILGNVTFP